MAANTNPIFTLTPKMSWVKFRSTTYTAPNNSATATDGTSANTVLAATMGADGGFVTRITFKAMGTNAVGVARVYVNNGSTNGTATNNSLLAEVALPATTASATTWTAGIELPLMRQFPASYKIYIDTSSTSFTDGWAVTAEWGDY